MATLLLSKVVDGSGPLHNLSAAGKQRFRKKAVAKQPHATIDWQRLTDVD
jgi:hypothetical protein